MRHPILSHVFGLMVLFIALPLNAFGQAPDFEKDVAPLLIRRCLECHQAANPSGDLSLETAAGLAQGGQSGAVLDRIAPVDSLLLQRVVSGEMPPVKHGESQQLPPNEIAVLQRWAETGAVFPDQRRLDLYEQTTDVRGGRDWWSFQPLTSVVVPHDESASPAANPIDRFIAQTLRTHGLTPAPPAATDLLVRRLYWDVTGLPATAADIQNVSQSADQKAAVTELVDALLDSPQFGERWARHWLDVVRFAETCGYERDQVKPFAWKYRDWVVNAFNSDMPYDQFIREQLAGDELPNRSEQSVIATGFLCLGTWNDEPNDAEDYKYERLEDLVHTTSSAFLGMTTKCARCHDHKFDPIPQTDYYRMAAAFWPGPIQPRDRDLIGGPSAEELGYKDVLGWTDITKSPEPLHKLRNGERHSPLEPVSAGALSCVQSEFREFTAAPADARTTGLRLQLADWIAMENNPLTARVIVNRLWQHHFGHGLVRSSNNFGYTGDKPTHPELLDWLAAELIRSGLSLKHIHRLILTSQTWQQASLHPGQDEYNQIDAANRFLWRTHRRRKDAESLRDGFLSATGELDQSLGGPSFHPTISAEALEGLSRKASAWNASPPADQLRRSLYIFTQRSLLPPLMTTFDMCDSTLSCGQRDVTIVAPQALTLLNNEFVHQRAAFLATKILHASQQSPDARSSDSQVSDAVERVWISILNRRPAADELEFSIQHVNRQKQQFAIAPAIVDQHKEETLDGGKLLKSAVLLLNAASLVTTNSDGRVSSWKNANGDTHEATQSIPELCPVLVKDCVNGHPAVRFDGVGSFMNIAGSLLSHDEATVLAVVTDQGAPGHRELLSNWSGRDGNSATSFFVGMTNENAVRLSDAVSGVGEIRNRQRPFLLTATNGTDGAMVFQQHRTVTAQTTSLPARRLDTPWVIGQQGNIGGEYWKGDVACLAVFDQQLNEAERKSVQALLIDQFALPVDEQSGNTSEPAPSPDQLALASLCLVLFNSNEFAYID